MTEDEKNPGEEKKTAREKDYHQPDNYTDLENTIYKLQEKHSEKVKKKVNRDSFQRLGYWLENQLHKSLGLCSKNYRNWIHGYKGFLSKEDGYLDYNEWHVTAWSSLLAVGTFTLHELFAGLYVLITIRVIRDEYSEHSSLAEIDMELPYWFGFFIVVSLVLQGMGYSADFSVLTKLLALLGL